MVIAVVDSRMALRKGLKWNLHVVFPVVGTQLACVCRPQRLLEV